MLRLMAALAVLLACGIAPVSQAQEDCDEEALAAGECGGEADDADEASVDADSEGQVDEEMADAESPPEDENVEPMADEESGDEVAAEDEDADLSDAAEEDEAAGADTAAAGEEEEEEESDDDFDTEIAAATDDDDGDDDASADAASGDDLLSTPPPGAPDAPRPPPSAPSVPATQTPAPPVTQTPASAPSAGTPTPAAQANCSGGGYRKLPGGRCGTAPAPAQAPPGPVNIYVGNLSWTMTEDDLKSMFEVHGTVSQAKIVRDRANGNRSKGFGFVSMPDRAEAETAINFLNDTEVQGRRIVVNDSQPRSGR